MITPDFRKKMTESWFSYLQIQICKEFEYLEKNKVKFSKRDWSKYKLKMEEISISPFKPVKKFNINY